MTNKKKVKIQASKEDLKGHYSNIMRVSNSKEEFVLDFFMKSGANGVLNSRIIVSPNHLKRIVKTLANSVKKYEKKFGPIEESEKPESKIGFVK